MLSLAFALVAAALAHATPEAPKLYNLNVEVKKDGKVLTAPNLSVIEGESASYASESEQGGSFVEVTAKESKKGQGVMLDLTVGGVDAKGKKTVYARPKIAALAGQPVTTTIKDKKQGEVTVQVLAVPQN